MVPFENLYNLVFLLKTKKALSPECLSESANRELLFWEKPPVRRKLKKFCTEKVVRNFPRNYISSDVLCRHSLKIRLPPISISNFCYIKQKNLDIFMYHLCWWFSQFGMKNYLRIWGAVALVYLLFMYLTYYEYYDKYLTGILQRVVRFPITNLHFYH